MLYLNPHLSNKDSKTKPRVEKIELTKEALIVEVSIELEKTWVNEKFNNDNWDNWGLWDFDVIELFLQKQKGEYLELQVSPLSQKFALLVQKPRLETKKIIDLESSAIGEFRENHFCAKFEVKLAEIPGSSESVFGNIHCILGESAHREYFSLNLNQEAKPDFHRPELFVNLGEL